MDFGKLYDMVDSGWGWLHLSGRPRPLGLWDEREVVRRAGGSPVREPALWAGSEEEVPQCRAERRGFSSGVRDVESTVVGLSLGWPTAWVDQCAPVMCRGTVRWQSQ